MHLIFSRGFSLVELLVVVSLISILSAAALNSYSNAAGEARDAKRIADMEAIGQALELFYQDHGRYPGVCEGIPLAGQEIGEGAEIDDALQPYLGTIPRDPMADQQPSVGQLFFYSYDPQHDLDECAGGGVVDVGITYGFNFSETGISDRETCSGGDMNLDNAAFNRTLLPPSDDPTDC
ncbi:MAG: type II secretion system protein [Patescibacteria group bacterium]